MSRLPDWWSRQKRDLDLDRELRFHIERRVEDLVAGGVPTDEAKRRAALELGGAEQVKEACRDVRRTRWLEDLGRDLRHGFRMLRRSPVFAAAAVVSLALGIGANTAIFSLTDLVMLRMMPVREPERLVQFQKHYPPYGRGNISYPAFEYLNRELRTMEGILGQFPLSQRDVTIGGQEEKADLVLVSGSYYHVLGISAHLGRTFGSEVERHPGENLVAVISHAYWRRRFGQDPAAVGKTIQFNGKVFTIIGVTPPDFFGTVAGRSPDLTLPLFTDSETLRWKTRPQSNWLSVIGRMRSGMDIRTAEREVRAVFARMVADYAQQIPNERQRRAEFGQWIELLPAGNGFDDLREQFSRPLAILMGIAALVLLIACANVANLLLARSAARQREIAVRLAIGAGRGRVIRQLLAEGLLLAALGGTLGVFFAPSFANGLVTMMSNGGPRMALEVNPDLRILGFACVVSLGACLLFSLAPALLATRRMVLPALAEARATRWRLGKGLIVVQAAISLLLLIGAGLFGRTLIRMYGLDTGFDRQGVVTFTVDAARAGYRDENLRSLRARIVSSLSTVPGVSSVSVGLLSPVGGGWDGSVDVEGYQHRSDESNISHFNAVGSRFFQTLRTPVVLGREFEERDTLPGAKGVAVVNEAFARYYFQDQSPIGRWIIAHREKGRIEIVGVVRNMKGDLRRAYPRTVYFTQLPGSGRYFVRSAVGPAETARSIEATVSRIDPALRIREILPLDESFSRMILKERMLATLAGFFGGLALLLSAVGIYGVMAFQVARRRREIGIRIALGARPVAVLGAVLGQTVGLVTGGSVIGAVAALASTRLAENLLFGVSPTDPATFAGAAAGLVSVALLAAYVPGRRAARVDPVEALRSE